MIVRSFLFLFHPRDFFFSNDEVTESTAKNYQLSPKKKNSVVLSHSILYDLNFRLIAVSTVRYNTEPQMWMVLSVRGPLLHLTHFLDGDDLVSRLPSSSSDCVSSSV